MTCPACRGLGCHECALWAGKPESSLSALVGAVVGCVQVCSCVPDPNCAVHGKQPESTVTTTQGYAERDLQKIGTHDGIPRFASFQPPVYFGGWKSDDDWKRSEPSLNPTPEVM